MTARQRDILAALVFLAPNFGGFLVFVAFPVVFSIAMAFTNWDLSLHNRFRQQPLEWAGLHNFATLLSQREFWQYLGNTLFLMMAIPLQIAGSLALALLLTRELARGPAWARFALGACAMAVSVATGLLLMWLGYGAIYLVLAVMSGIVLWLGLVTGSAVYRTLLYLPSFTSGVAIFLLWKKMYNPISGPINTALRPLLAGLERVVRVTPDWGWSGLGYLLWVAAGLGCCGWLGGCCETGGTGSSGWERAC